MRRAVMGQRRPVKPTAELAGDLTRVGVLEFRATFCDKDKLYAERGARRTRPWAPKGDSGGHGGSHREGVARLTAARGGKATARGKVKQRRGRGSHHAGKPRAKEMASSRRRRGKSTPAIGG
jgi:hypothetical protein